MNKPHFIQLFSAHWGAKASDLNAMIDRAEQVWNALSARGYGSKTHKPREAKNWYAELGLQRQMFDQFWSAFAYKQGRNEAAGAWLKIDPTGQEAEKIILAAKAEAANRSMSDKTPIMAQGWLSQRRFDDFEPESKRETVKQNTTSADIAYARRMADMLDGEQQGYWLSEVERLTKKTKPPTS